MSDKLKSASIDDRIDVYEDRMLGWFLRPIFNLLATPDFRFAAVSLALSYFEGWEQYRSGEDSRNQSKEFFIRGLRDVFPVVRREVADRGDDLAQELALIYEQVRCGAFHDGIMRARVVLATTGAPMSFAAHKETLTLSAIVINPEAFVADIAEHFRRYITQLRDSANAELREKFTKTWERVHAVGVLHVPPEIRPGP